MSAEIEITRGGVIAVDVETLRSLIPRMHLSAERLSLAAARVRQVRGELAVMPEAREGAYLLAVLGRELAARVESVREAAHRTEMMAQAYEIVEQRSRVRFAATLDTRALVEVRRSLATREMRSTEAVALAEELLAAREAERRAAFGRQAWALFWAPAAALVGHWALRGFLDAVDRFGRGIPVAAVGGDAPLVGVYAGLAKSSAAPAGLAKAFGRIPQTAAQLRVEKYEMPDGTRHFVVYIAGTRALAGADPWNMASNLALYGAQEASSSYEATRQALLAAGAEAGDAVHAIGHSQGGMIAGHLGMAGEFDVRSVITAGSPIEPVLEEAVLSVQLRHSDDPVSALAAGGSPAGTGATGSIVVEREGDPALGAHDILLPTHGLDRYIETARAVDASSDPRTATLEALWAQLAAARRVTATEFTARIPSETVGASGQDAL